MSEELKQVLGEINKLSGHVQAVKEAQIEQATLHGVTVKKLEETCTKMDEMVTDRHEMDKRVDRLEQSKKSRDWWMGGIGITAIAAAIRTFWEHITK